MKKLFQFLMSKAFRVNAGLIILVAIILVFLINIWLKQYTRHGQKLPLPDFTERQLEEAVKMAREQSFKLIVTDSIHVVGEHGSKVLKQSPAPGFHVKENRKIYVTVTKHNPDMVSIKSLPVMYGENYERKKRELDIGFEINSEVVGSIYDIGPEGHIMMVIYEQDTIIRRSRRVQDLDIPKGGTLRFILSKSTGGLVEVPNLLCQSYEAAKFLLNGYKLTIGDARADATVEDHNSAYVYKQDPDYADEKRVEMGTAFTLYLTQDQPKNCD